MSTKRIGSKIEVWNGIADHTSGGLRKSDLVENKRGKIVSRKKQALGKTAFKKNKLIPKNREEFEMLKGNVVRT